jgi:glyoxylase-like metal-dependent hydrolase (beta-lactamase superfamily II)
MWFACSKPRATSGRSALALDQHSQSTRIGAIPLEGRPIVAWEVQVLKLGQAEVPVPEILFMTGFDEWAVLAFWMVVATDGERVAIVNTGMPDDLTEINAYWEMAFGPKYGKRTQIIRTEGEKPLIALRSIGIEPRDVDDVIVTPLMAYSAANLTSFPNAQYHLSRRGWVSRLAPEYGWVKVRGGDKPPLARYTAPLDIYVPPEQLHHLLYEAYNRFDLIDEGEVAPGLSVWWAGVHHRGSLAVQIDSTAGVVIASDAFFYYENVENDHYLGVGESFSEAMATYARTRRDADHIIPLHDPKVLDRYPGGKIQGPGRRAG